MSRALYLRSVVHGRCYRNARKPQQRPKAPDAICPIHVFNNLAPGHIFFLGHLVALRTRKHSPNPASCTKHFTRQTIVKSIQIDDSLRVPRNICCKHGIICLRLKLFLHYCFNCILLCLVDGRCFAIAKGYAGRAAWQRNSVAGLQTQGRSRRRQAPEPIPLQ